MENQIFSDIGTVLDLNGPTLSFITQPTGVTGIGTSVGGTGGASIELVGIATATFVGSADSIGTISYQWYYDGGVKVENDTYITGAATTTLTLSNLITPTDSEKKYYLQADYVPTYVGLGTGYQTGNALNDPLSSGIGTVSVTPLLEIIAQPTSAQAEIDTNKTFTVNADLTDSFYDDDLTYQWILDGEDITDGVITTTATTGSVTPGDVEHSYTSPGSHTTPALATDIEVTIAAGRGGGGGTDAGGPSGASGDGRAGRFSLPDGAKTLEFKIGGVGNGGGNGAGSRSGPGSGGQVSGSGDGGRGGNAGPGGWSGAGGGGGATSSILNDSTRIIVAGGGGGGGGGSLHAWGRPGSSGGSFGSTAGSISVNNGSGGCNMGGDGGGGGGGGGGNTAGGSGGCGQDNSHGGGGGGGGPSAYKSPQSTLLNQWTNDGAGYANLKYTGYTDTTITVTRETTVSGTDTNTLTIKTDHTTVKTLQCRISSDTASNSPILTDEVSFAVVDTTVQANINIESIGITDTANISTIDLQNGEYTFEIGVNDEDSVSSEYYSFYSPDRDIDVEMDLYGGKGADGPNTNNADGQSGGEGGYSRIQFTMEQNVEYVFAGLTVDTQSPFLYRKAELMAVVGGGGQGGADNRMGWNHGASGGGVGIAGADSLVNGGPGGALVTTLGANGIFGSTMRDVAGNPIVNPYPGDSVALGPHGNLGGQTIKCTKGQYWAQQGKGACDDLGSVKFRLQDGTEVTNTSSSITRGFKAGYNIMQTKGKGENGGGEGGSGATGGQGATAPGGSGGGGSGYQDGSVTVIDTMQGGSTGDAKVVLRVVT